MIAAADNVEVAWAAYSARIRERLYNIHCTQAEPFIVVLIRHADIPMRRQSLLFPTSHPLKVR